MSIRKYRYFEETKGLGARVDPCQIPTAHQQRMRDGMPDPDLETPGHLGTEPGEDRWDTTS